MSVNPVIGPSRKALIIRNLAAVMLLLMPIAALGTRFGLWSFKLGLLLVVLAIVIGILIQITSWIWLVQCRNTATKKELWRGLILSFPALLILIINLSKPNGFVLIHNISTDPENPPDFIVAPEHRGKDSNPLTYTPEIAAIQKQAYPDLKTLHTNLDARAAFKRSLAVAEKLGWEIYARDPEFARIEAVDTTFWFGFKDDVVIRIEASGEGGSRIDLRSVSRVGGGDAGTNARRIQSFISAFKTED